MPLSHLAYAPAYTNARTNVFKFLTFMASDEALMIYKKKRHRRIPSFQIRLQRRGAHEI